MSLLKSIQLQPNEKIIKIVHPFWPVYFWWYLLSFVLIIAPFFFMFWLFARGRWGVIVFAATLVLGIYLLFRTIFLNYYNALIITSERLFKLTQLGAWHKQVSEVSFDDISQVSAEVRGLRQSIFKYGSLKVESEGGLPALEARGLRHPFEIQQTITAWQNSSQQQKHIVPPSANIAEQISRLSSADLEKLARLIEERRGASKNSPLEK